MSQVSFYEGDIVLLRLLSVLSVAPLWPLLLVILLELFVLNNPKPPNQRDWGIIDPRNDLGS